MNFLKRFAAIGVRGVSLVRSSNAPFSAFLLQHSIGQGHRCILSQRTEPFPSTGRTYRIPHKSVVDDRVHLLPSTRHLRHSREVTQVCSPKVSRQNSPGAALCRAAWKTLSRRTHLALLDLKHLRASGVDDGGPTFLARGQGVFLAWATLSEQKWVTLRERRGRHRRFLRWASGTFGDR